MNRRNRRIAAGMLIGLVCLLSSSALADGLLITGGPSVLEGGVHILSQAAQYRVSGSGEPGETLRITAQGASVTLAGVSLSSADKPALEIATQSQTMPVTIILEDGTENTLKSGAAVTPIDANHMYGFAGLENGVNAIVITCKSAQAGGEHVCSDRCGRLIAYGGVNQSGNTKFGGAGIGSRAYDKAGWITINGGIIEAYGADGGAGIGSGRYAGAQDITINGGQVTAIGSNGAGVGAGMGGGTKNITITSGIVTAVGQADCSGIGASGGDAQNIAISGGTITATGGEWGAGIGTSALGKASDITIDGGIVTATGGTDGAGIGTVDGVASGITISGGTVTAIGGRCGAGIGAGVFGKAKEIVISGGIVTATGGRYGEAIGRGQKGAAEGISLRFDGCHVRLLRGSSVSDATDEFLRDDVADDYEKWFKGYRYLHAEFGAHGPADGIWSSDENGHWYCCACGRQSEKEAHSGGMATCTKQAVCSICSIGYNGIDETNHDGGTLIKGRVEADEFSEGYSGDVYCLGCDELLEKGIVIPATHLHAYTMRFDETGHWNECICGEKTGICAHIPGSEVTETGVQICTECGFEFAPMLSPERDLPETGDASQSGMWIMLLTMSAIIMVELTRMRGRN